MNSCLGCSLFQRSIFDVYPGDVFWIGKAAREIRKGDIVHESRKVLGISHRGGWVYLTYKTGETEQFDPEEIIQFIIDPRKIKRPIQGLKCSRLYKNIETTDVYVIGSSIYEVQTVFGERFSKIKSSEKYLNIDPRMRDETISHYRDRVRN